MAVQADVLPDGEYVLDPAQSVFCFGATAFLLLPVKGTLRATAGSFSVAGGKIAAEGSAEAASVATGIKARDWHLRYKHYLHVGANPEIRLVIPPVAVDANSAVATLHVRGRSVEVPLQLESLAASSDGTVRARLTGSFDRTPLRMLHRLGGVSTRVEVTFDVVARKQPR